MNAALQAEQRARDAIKTCERQAAELIGSAQQQSRSITERANRGISDLHVRCAHVITEEIDAMMAEDADDVGHATQPALELAALEAAVERVAARLTGEPKATD
jgi:cell division septum initiation protein DivIVA